jgi:hypothetical protein
MSSVRYSNGMYKSTSKSQEKKSQELFTKINPDSMSYNLDQESGLLKIFLVRKDDKPELIYTLNRIGKIVSHEYRYVNEESKFWDNSYQVFLQEFDSKGIIVNADNEQEALDFAVDYAESQGWVGLFLDQSELDKLSESEQENLVMGGNHCLALSWESGPIINKLS